MAKPPLHVIPDNIESQRLLIRAPNDGDGPMLNEAIAESWPELQIWMPWAQKLPTVEESEEFCRTSHSKYLAKEDLILFILDKSSKSFIGSSGLHRIDWSVPKFEIGYWCRTSRTGQGYITEAVMRIVQFAFESLNAQRLEIRMDDRNERSWRIPERIGFSLEGILRNESRDNSGKLRDTRIYSILPTR